MNTSDPIRAGSNASNDDKRTTIILPVWHVEPWQKYLTAAVVNILRATTRIPFELVIAETQHHDAEELADRYLHFPDPISLVKKLNETLQTVTTEWVVGIGNDVFVRPGWLEALHACFTTYPDCGYACLGGSELKHAVEAKIVEGFYHAVTMMRRGWFYDEDFESWFGDADLLLRVYQHGQRAYRNHAVVVDHLGSATYRTLYSNDKKEEIYNRGLELLKKKHGNSPLLVYRALVNGMIL